MHFALPKMGHQNSILVEYSMYILEHNYDY